MTLKRNENRLVIPLIIALLATVSGALLFVLKNPLHMDDSLRHVKMGMLMWQNGLFSTNGWGEFFYAGVMVGRKADPWFLYHVLLAPFGSFDPVLTLKIVPVITTIVVLSIFVYLLRPLNLPTKAVVILLILFVLGETTFATRMFNPRPYTLMTGVNLLVLDSILRQKKYVLAITCFFATLLSQLFVFTGVIVALGCLWLWSRFGFKKTLHIGLFAGLGFLLGLMLHPDPVDFLQYYFEVFLRIPFMDATDHTVEFHSGFARALPFLEVLLFSLLLILSTGLSVKKMSIKKLNETGITLIVLICLFFFYSFCKWQRSISNLWPFVLVLAAFVIAHVPQWKEIVAKQMFHPDQRIRSGLLLLGILLLSFFVYRLFDFLWPVIILLLVHILRPAFAQSEKGLGRVLGFIGVIIVLFNCVHILFWTTQSDANRDLDLFRALNHIPSGAKILNVDWDQFPIYFLLRSDLLYATGFDANTLELHDEDIAKHIRVLTLDEMRNPPPGTMVNGSAWLQNVLRLIGGEYLLFTSAKHPAIIESLKTVPKVELVSEEGSLTLFKVL